MHVRAQETVTVSVVVRDQRGFTHIYEDFVVPPETAQGALQVLAAESGSAVRNDPSAEVRTHTPSVHTVPR